MRHWFMIIVNSADVKEPQDSEPCTFRLQIIDLII